MKVDLKVLKSRYKLITQDPIIGLHLIEYRSQSGDQYFNVKSTNKLLNLFVWFIQQSPFKFIKGTSCMNVEASLSMH